MAGKKKPRNQTERQQTEEKLLETEEMYRNLVERANDGIIVVQDMVIKYVNPRLTEMMGYTVEEMTGSKFSKFLVPEELAKQTARYEQRMAGKNIPSVYETVILLNDGRRLEVELNAGIIQYDGKPANLAFMRDISYRKKNERDLRESDEKLRGIFSSIDDLIFGCDENGKFVYYHSPLGAKLYVPAEEFLGKKYSEVLPSRITKQINIGFKNNKKKKAFEFEYWLKMEGEKYWFSAKMSPVFIEDEFKGFVALIRDVTERKQVERELIQHRENLEELVKQRTAEFMESEERWRSLAENAPDIVIILDLDGRISYINRVVPGIEKEEVIGKNQYEYISPEYHELVKKTINDVIKNGKPGSYTIQGVGPEGKISWYNTQVGPLKEGDDVNGVVLFIQDITEQKLVEEALRESEEKYRTLVEDAGDGIVLFGMDGKITYVNKYLLDLGSYQMEEVVGHDFTEFVPEEYLPITLKLFEDYVQGIESPAVEMELKTKEGKLVPVDYKGSIIYEEGEIVGIRAIIRDITKRKKAEDALRESEEKYRMILTSSPYAITVSDLTGRIIEYNQRALNLFGFKNKKEAIGKSSFDFIAPVDREKAIKNIGKTLKEGAARNEEYAFLRVDGTEFQGELSATVIRDAEGKPISFVAIIHDITERKAMENELKESEEKYRSLFEFSPESITIIDLEGTILECNDATTRIAGIPKKELIGNSFLALGTVFEEDMDKYQRLFNQILEGEPIESVEVKVNQEGNVCWIESFPTPLKKDGEIYAIQIITRDVTERKKAEMEMRRQLLKFDVEDGNVYMVKERRPEQSIEIFNELLEVGYLGHIVSRAPAKHYKANIEKLYVFTWISERGSQDSVLPNVTDIEKSIDNLPTRQSILFEGLDYLVSKAGFKKVLSLVQALAEIAFMKDHIIILSVDPSAMDETKLRKIEKETSAVATQMALGKISEKLLEILKFVNKENLTGINPSFSDVEIEEELSKPTVRKRIKELQTLGCVKVTEKGRNKYLAITEKGKTYMVLK